MKLRTAFLTAVATALVIAPSAMAHVTINPDKAPADSFSRFALRVPTEEPVATVRISIQLPEGLEEAGFQPKPGWTRTQSGRVVTWSGGEIGPGEFDEFGLSIHVPNTPGEELVFPATQTYADGTVVRWIGEASSDEPAPRVTIEEAEGEGDQATTTTTTATSAAADDGEDDDNDAFTLALASAGLAVGLIALGLSVRRRRP